MTEVPRHPVSKSPTLSTRPQRIPHNIVEKSEEDQKHQLMNLVQEMGHFGYGMLDSPEKIKPNNNGTSKTMYVVKSEGQQILIQPINATKPEPDRVIQQFFPIVPLVSAYQ